MTAVSGPSVKFGDRPIAGARPIIIASTCLVFAIIGIAVAAGGIWLITLGGSWYYAIAGLVFITAAVLIWRRSATALWLYAAFVIATLGWAIWEIGFDWWQLGPRGGVIVLLALWLLTPWVRRKLTGSGAAALALAVVTALVVAGYSLTVDPYELVGELSTETVSGTPNRGGDVPVGDWHFYGGTQFGQHYSPLTQITAENVAKLQEAWTYRTGDLRRSEDVPETTYQVTPLKAGDTLYICTPHNFAIAIDAATGKEKWRFDPKIGLDKDRQHQTCRGVSYYADAKIAPGVACRARIYLPTSDARLIALDATNGQVCLGFAEGGTLNLLASMPYANKSGHYYSTSAPLVAGGKVIVGGAVNDNNSTEEPSGVIRAYDAETGQLIWNWDSGNPLQTKPIGPNETYTSNSPNMWSTASADEKLGLVYLPLGNQTPDQLGMGRSENVEKFSTSITALDLNTGQVRWVRQTVHHDLWDMDVPAQPTLVDIRTAAGVVPALVGPTKQGDLYVLDRRTGEPVIPVKEVPAPGGAIEGDHSSPTQPVSELTFMPQPLVEHDMWGMTLFDQLACRIGFHRLRYEGRYTPPSLQGSLIYPGNFGVFNWGGVAVDPVRQVMFGMPTYLAFTSQLIPRDQVPPPGDTKGSEQGLNRNEGAPYAVKMGPFLSPLGIPCQTPPWGYVAGADLRTGKIVYKRRNGTVSDMTPLPLPLKVGVPGIGGPMITAGGVAFLGAAVDDYLRAYDVTTGTQLWQARLPAGGQSTPMSYETSDGRQFVVIVAGGHGSVGTKPGDYVKAYALPR